MECFPPLSADVTSDAWPLLRATVASRVEPSRNCTVPVAVEDDTVAVNVTGRPLLDGLGSDVNVVVVPALLTVCESAEDVLPVWLPSPLYCAVMAWVPTARLEVEKAATPLALSADVPSAEAPSMNVTVPVTPEDGLTVAVNVTCCPNAEGFSEDDNDVVVLTVPAMTACVKDKDVLPVKLVSPL
jgi:hypothetical protein